MNYSAPFLRLDPQGQGEDEFQGMSIITLYIFDSFRGLNPAKL